MRSFLGLLAFGAIAAAGCAGGFVDRGPSACVATYVKLPSGNYAGMDLCGNTWIRTADGHCYMLVDSLEALVEIYCPAEGETLAVLR